MVEFKILKKPKQQATKTQKKSLINNESNIKTNKIKKVSFRLDSIINKNTFAKKYLKNEKNISIFNINNYSIWIWF